MAHPRGVIFDMDGTLTQPGSIDFAAMRARVGAPLGVDVLDHIAMHSDPEERARLHSVIEEEEEAGFARQQFMPDASAVLELLTGRGLRLAVVTRNNESIMARTLDLLKPVAFSVTLSRAFTPAKPHPAPILHICRIWGCEPRDVVMVGDSTDDILCGRAAGARTVLVGEPGQHGHAAAAPHAEAVARTLTDVVALLDEWGAAAKACTAPRAGPPSST